MNLYTTSRKILFMLEPERAHAISLFSLDVLHKLGLLRLITGKRVLSPVTVMGIEFPNPIGLAAGLDKNGDHINSLAACGFGFIEIGTVTPKPQPGNPKPRLFRLVEDRAIINRMGFNNKGVDYLVRQVKKSGHDCVLGINIGKNKITPLENAADDYCSALESVYQYADYVTINISSPNTPGLRELQYGEELDHLLSKLKSKQQQLKQHHGKYVPLVVKIAPDLEEAEISVLAETFIKHNIDGVIATNTTNDRPDLNDPQSVETGGLSGKPLITKADTVLKLLVGCLQGKMPVIAVGGVFSSSDAKRKMELGASLVQIYTGFIYEGPALIHECVKAVSIES
jgi:dihydroorotate dehydrogenase